MVGKFTVCSVTDENHDNDMTCDMWTYVFDVFLLYGLTYPSKQISYADAKKNNNNQQTNWMDSEVTPDIFAWHWENNSIFIAIFFGFYNFDIVMMIHFRNIVQT